MQIDLPYVYEDLDRHGNVRIYFWRGKGHSKVRIREQPGTKAFRDAYDAAAALDTLKREPTPEQAAGIASNSTVTLPKPGTYRWLCARYMAECADYLRNDLQTRKTRKQILEATYDEPIAPDSSDTFANMPLEYLSLKALYVLRDRKLDLPGAGNNRVKALRQVFKWAVAPNVQIVKVNLARDIKLFETEGDGFHTWTIEEVRAFAKRHPLGTKAHLALGLLLFTGVRRSDVVLLGRQMIRDGWLHFTEKKHGRRKPKARQLPVLPALRHIVDHSPAGNLTFLVTEYDRPFTGNGFGNKMRDWCDQAGLPQCSAHGLRKAGATIAADNGATEHQLMAIFGWESPKQAALYTRKANRRKLAGAGMAFIDLGDLDGIEDVDDPNSEDEA
ncbi:site-specific integrase [Bosea sp. BK604]|uniref:tyrosine-type recombinase/integrase n=1 Tax=Bosea sp. BK604 TaxID=2512180 RepID=UPI001050CE22|nr:site-specific integrase [Bosea sp. BK604]TCR69726.1 integrase [Bosea sp. BK604]